MQIHELLAGDITCTAEINGHEVSVTYDPNGYTPESEARWAVNERSMWVGPMMTDFVCTMVTAWDLEEEDGTPVKITPERVAQIPVTVTAPILTAILASVTGAGSGSGNGNRAQRRARPRR